MVRRTRRAFVVTAATALAGAVSAPAYAATAAARTERPLARAHAHNDYEHPRPLTDALSHGFGSVEADIWLVGDQLLIGHDETELDPSRTLESLYLDPLARRIEANGGSVFSGWPLSLELLIDIKTAGEPTYRELARHLAPYRRMLSSVRGGVDGRVRRGAVTAVVSGDRGARAPMEAERTRYAFYDGRFEDLGTGVPASFIPLVSQDWTAAFGWTGAGPMPPSERGELCRIVASAHAEGRRVRFWATPDQPGPERDALWRRLLAAGVDLLNTDDLAGLESFLRGAG
jgi:Glycerophosphoryl diester phosphodiesterase family